MAPRRHIGELIGSDAIGVKLFRFALVGASSSVLYGVMTWALVDCLHMAPAAGSAIGYVLAIPPNFLLQRRFSFRSLGRKRIQLPKFLLVHGINVIASVVIMQMITARGASHLLGILAVMVLIPLLSFLIMNSWIFPKTDGFPEK